MGIKSVIYKNKGYKNEDELIDLMVKLIRELSRYKTGLSKSTLIRYKRKVEAIKVMVV